jgi:YVTN family beta-propeller protein
LLLLMALAGLLVAGRLRVTSAVRTTAVGRIPTAVVVDARTRRVFVANMRSNTVSMLDAASGTVLATITVAPHPSALAVATTVGRIFAVSDRVTPDGAGRVSVLDATSGRQLRTVAVGRGPHTLAVHEHTGRVFVTNQVDASVSLLDARSGRLLRTVAVGQGPHALAVHKRAARVFVTNAGDGSVSVLDARTGHVLRTSIVGLSPLAVAVVESLKRVFIANGGLWYSGYQVTRGTVSVLLDEHTGAVVRTVPVGRNPGPLAVDERTGYVFVANQADNSVSTVHAASGRVVRTVPLGLPPRAIAVDQRQGRVVVLTSEEFVPSAPAGRVQVLDGRTGRLLHTVPVGADATALAVDERTGKVFAAAMNVYGLPAGSDNTRWLRAWLRRWLPWSWVSRLLPPVPAPTTGTVTMLDLAGVAA